jgi:hypothetical protein
MAQNSMKHHVKSQADAKWEYIFRWTCNIQYFEKDHNSRIKSIFEIGEKKNKRQKAKIATFVKSHVSCDGLLT